MTPEQLLLDLSERVRSRYYGKYRGTVTDIDADTLRIKATVPAVLGAQASGWAMPCVPYAGPQVGMAFLPEVGSGVWIEFEGGDVSYPIWVGCYWRAGELPSEAKPAVKAIITKSKTKLLIDDDQSTVELSDGNNNKATLSSSGITVERESQKLAIEPSKTSINGSAFEVM
jgi:uncharacterized protein involved in type VI secretion and phage assembly